MESLDDRSRPSGWNIRPHAHANLHHIFFLDGGGGQMRSEGRLFTFDAPVLLLMPARRVHSFSWYPESSGRVLTVSDAYLHELLAREPVFRSLFEDANCLMLPPRAAETKAIASALSRVTRELSWTAPGHAAAIEANLVSLLVEILRIARWRGEGDTTPPGPQAEIVARFREAVEENFRTARTLEDYAAELGVSITRLRAACLKIAGQPPLRLVQDRVLLEAKRVLLYSNMTVAEAAYYLGFDDPAYFSRMFHRGCGESPRAFRARHFKAVAHAHRRSRGRARA
jgi:AraC family transcriptional activator of pobA